MRSIRSLVAGLFAVLIGSAAWGATCDGFTDVDSTASYCVAVTYLKNTGITLGCTSTTYCPSDNVTRAQMALFLYRLGNNVAFQQGGNAFGMTAHLGTTDANPIEIHVAGDRVMRYEQPHPLSPNLIAGSPANGTVSSGSIPGVVIAGGGAAGATCYDPTTGLYTGTCSNEVKGEFGTVGGGSANKSNSVFGFDVVSGGSSNQALGGYSVVSGGKGNAVTGFGGFVGGGDFNFVSGDDTVIAGGEQNVAGGYASTIGGGTGNETTANEAVVAGGLNNTASGATSAISGGQENIASGVASAIIGGSQNVASGLHSVVLGGLSNSAAGELSVVLGFQGETTTAGKGSFVFSDSTGATPYGSGNANEFLVAASGGIRMNTAKDYTTGCRIPAGGGAWSCSSSREIKRDFSPVDAAEILAKVAALPVMRWRYMNEPADVRHIGTFSQDFRAAFGLGEDEKSISTVDADGIAMAAIQALNAKVDARDAVIAQQARRIEELAARLDVLTPNQISAK